MTTRKQEVKTRTEINNALHCFLESGQSGQYECRSLFFSDTAKSVNSDPEEVI